MTKQNKKLTLEGLVKKVSEKPAKPVDHTVFKVKGRSMDFSLLVRVYSFLSPHCLKQAGRVNRLFREVSKQETLWERHYKWKVGIISLESNLKNFFQTDRPPKNSSWRQSFEEINHNITKDESQCIIKNAHMGCQDKHTIDDRKSRFLPLTGVNNLQFAMHGTTTIPKCLLFSSSRPTIEGFRPTLKVWSVTPVGQSPPPFRDEPYDLLTKIGTPVGVEGWFNPSLFSIRNVSTRNLGDKDNKVGITKMYPVYTYFKEQMRIWEYACICGDESGNVSFLTGSCANNSEDKASVSSSVIFKTEGKVSGLKCLLEEPGFSGYKLAFGCGFSDSGQLYDLQSNSKVCSLPHAENANTDSMDISMDSHHLVLGQVQRRNNQPCGIVRLFDMKASEPEEIFAQQVATGPVKCVRFCNFTNDSGDGFFCTSRDGLSFYDKRQSKVALKYPTSAPLDQLCIVSNRSLVVCTCGPDLLLYDVRNFRPIRRIPHGHSWCSSLACDHAAQSDTAGLIITGGTEGTIRFWNIQQLWSPSSSHRNSNHNNNNNNTSSSNDSGNNAESSNRDRKHHHHHHHHAAQQRTGNNTPFSAKRTANTNTTYNNSEKQERKETVTYPKETREQNVTKKPNAFLRQHAEKKDVSRATFGAHKQAPKQPLPYRPPTKNPTTLPSQQQQQHALNAFYHSFGLNESRVSGIGENVPQRLSVNSADSNFLPNPQYHHIPPNIYPHHGPITHHHQHMMQQMGHVYLHPAPLMDPQQSAYPPYFPSVPAPNQHSTEGFSYPQEQLTHAYPYEYYNDQGVDEYHNGA